MKRFLSVLLALSAFLAAHGADPNLDRLRGVKLFAFGGVGFAGAITQGEKDYYTILARPTAEADFELVLSNSSPEGKAYALVAIRRLAPEKFKALSEPMRSSKAMVQTGMGCILMRLPLGELVKRIEAGLY
jgi:hypothetical protein